MPIDELKLIRGLIKNIDDLAKYANDPQGQALIKSSQTILFDLYRRSDFVRFAQYYHEGRALLSEASALEAIDGARTKQLEDILRALPQELSSDPGPSLRDQYLEEIRRGISALFKGSAYPFTVDSRTKTVLTNMSLWEEEGYKLRRPELPELSEQQKPVVVDGPLLERYLQRHRPGWEDAKIVKCFAIPGGFSKQTILFDVETASGVENLAYRGTNMIQIIGKVLVDIADEFHAVSYAYSHGAPVAEPLWLQSDRDAIGTRFFVSRRVPGTNLGTAMQAHQDISAAATRSLAESLAKIHGVPLDPESDLLKRSHLRAPAPGMSLQDVIRARINHWYDYFKSLDGGSYPAMDLAAQWLLENISPADGDEPVLVHGDYGLHNILIHEDRVTAALDWEACHVGDRALDLSHILAGTAGKMDRELFMKTYIAAGGKPVSEFRLKYYQVLMSMQFMLSTIDAQHIYRNNPGVSTDYCTLGLGFIHYTANVIMSGIMDASASKES